MSYWNDEMGDQAPRLEALSPRARLKVAAEALTWTICTLDPPIADPEVSEYIADGIERIEAAVQRGLTVPEGADDMATRYVDLFEEAWEPGAANFLTATLLCFSCSGPELLARHVMAQLLDLYEGALFRATEQRITPEVERSTPRATTVIEYQKQLIDRAVRGA